MKEGRGGGVVGGREKGKSANTFCPFTWLIFFVLIHALAIGLPFDPR